MVSAHNLPTVPEESKQSFDNDYVAQKLDEVGELLEAKGANPYRAQAYRRAAETIRGLESSLSDLLDSSGPAGLTELPGIGDSIARAVAQLLATGDFPLLRSLRGRSESNAVLTTVPGVGPKTAARIRTELGIETL